MTKNLTEEEYKYLMQDNKNKEMNKDVNNNNTMNVLPNYLPVPLHMMQQYQNTLNYMNTQVSNTKPVIIPGLISRFPANHTRDSQYFNKMSLMVPMNVDNIKIEWSRSSLITPPDLDQQMVYLHGIENYENNKRTLTIINHYDVGTITTTFTTSKSSLYEQRRQDRYQERRQERDEPYYSRNNYGYGYGNNKRQRSNEK